MPSADQQTISEVSSQDLTNTVTVLVARLGEEFQRTERIDSKGRQVLAVCAAFYAGAQALAFSGFAEGDVATVERLILSAVAVIATGALVRAGVALLQNERPRGDRSFKGDGVVKWFEQSSPGNEYVSRQLVLNLASTFDFRREMNQERYKGYEAVEAAARWCLLLVFVESVVAIAVRV